MKNLTLLLLLFSLLCSAQKEKKETVYLLFDIKNKEKCKVDIEGNGYQLLNKYRKVKENKSNYFIICNDYFAYSDKKNKVDTCSIKTLNNLKIVDLEYIKKKKSENVMRYNPFEKIYLIEKISDKKVVKHAVTWIDDWNMIRN